MDEYEIVIEAIFHIHVVSKFNHLALEDLEVGRESGGEEGSRRRSLFPFACA